MKDSTELAKTVEAFDALVRDLRNRCPWDREQTAKTIIPHTLEEVYELADAIEHNDDAAILDELGDVTFQVFFLALLLEERETANLQAVIEHIHTKLIRRHPHLFGDEQAEKADEVLAVWQKVKQEIEGRQQTIFSDVPATLPALLYARKLQRRAKSSGFETQATIQDALKVLEVATTESERSDAIGDLLFAVVDIARKQKTDPELSLRAASERFRVRVEQEFFDCNSPERVDP